MKKAHTHKIVINFWTIAKYVLIFFAFYILSLAGINHCVFPFAFAFLFALVWCNQNPYILSVLFVGAYSLATFSLFGVISAAISATVLIITYLIHLKAKKPIKVWLMGIYLLISQAGYLYFEIIGGTLFVFPVVSVVLSLLFFFAVVQFFQAIIVRGISCNLTASELICGGIILGALSCGLASINLMGFEFIKLFAPFVILFVCYTFGPLAPLVCAGIMGVGAMLSANQHIYLAAFVIWALVVCMFKYKNRIIPVVAVLASEVAIGFYFQIYGAYSWLMVLPVILGCLIFLAIPSKTLSGFAGIVSTSSDRMAMRNIVNRNREHLSRRLGDLSDIFGEMNKVFRAMIKGGLSQEDAKILLVQDIKERNCADCPEINRCHRAMADETNQLFYDFVSTAFERGRVGVLDIPPNLTSRCPKTTQLIATINEVSEQYKKYAGVMTSLDASKVLIAEQLGGISGIMKSLSQEVSKNISFDAGREAKIKDELTINNIICSDVVIYEQNLNIVNCTIIVKDNCLNIEKIERIVGKICSCKMKINDSNPAPISGWTMLTLATAPKFDVAFGASTQTKTGSETSGDSYSVIRIENDKFMFALCDGMGSGIKAEKASNLAIGLVENFYKAGFDSDTILSCVNKLLAIGSDDVFSALDLCVVDLSEGSADLIKLGAPAGFIKRENKIEVVEGGALPMGIVGNIRPFNKKAVLGQNDYVVLCTDGVSDSFMSHKDLAQFISQNSSCNPQELADLIVSKAVENCRGVALDDMSVIVARIFKN